MTSPLYPPAVPAGHPTSGPATGTEPFIGLDATVLDFWRFGMSDLRTNTLRGYLAEFLVARAVGTDRPRVEWDAFDVLTPEGIKVEVKATGFVQTWTQLKPRESRTWTIGQTVPYDSAGRPCGHRGFQADVYVFAVHTARTNDEYNALDVDQWKFYVLSAPQIMTLPRDRNDRACATLLRVQERTQAVIYTELAATVGEAATRQ
ncbi:hypothetical protein AB0N56_35545 [Streptomyces microflavus]|uniref:Uncharacterized protein n=1 Tax=Streptomyces microflavus TaxID=1919 RepID=A0A7H8N0T7_STRMI|nr:hypothetical protein [Streptomyces microflavus]QKW47996.1 hypothetical protein HUT09_36495 [Streptomyces microflavus]